MSPFAALVRLPFRSILAVSPRHDLVVRWRIQGVVGIEAEWCIGLGSIDRSDQLASRRRQ